MPERSNSIGVEDDLVLPRWNMPRQAETDSGLAVVNRSFSKIDVVKRDKEGADLRVVGFKVEMIKGESKARVQFEFDLQGMSIDEVTTSGWQSWTTSSTGLLGRFIGGGLVGPRPVEKSNSKHTEFFEPAVNTSLTAQGFGRSYGLVMFNETSGIPGETIKGRGDKQEGGDRSIAGETVAFGVVPDFVGTNTIYYKKTEEGKLRVVVEKNVGELPADREVNFQVFLGRTSPRSELGERGGRSADLMMAYGEELGRLTSLRPKEPVFDLFTWAGYGIGVRESDVEAEINAAAEVLKGGKDDRKVRVTIDDGWETVSGRLEVERSKFAHLENLVSLAHEKGVEIALWVAPFFVKKPPSADIKNDWLMRHSDGGLVELSVPLFQSADRWPPMERPYALDISNAEVRAYLVEKLTNLANMGFDAFKIDYMSVPFVAALQNNEKTAVEYYRQFLVDLRNSIKLARGRDIEMIACGAPILETIGVVENMRFTFDSAAPYLGSLRVIGPAIEALTKLSPVRKLVELGNFLMYQDAIAVAARRALVFGKAYGLMVDGVHLNDPVVMMRDEKKSGGRLVTNLKRRLAASLLALARLGQFGGMYVGDSLARADSGQKKEWQKYVESFELAMGREIPIDEIPFYRNVVALARKESGQE